MVSVAQPSVPVFASDGVENWPKGTGLGSAWGQATSEEGSMAGLEVRDFSAPDETRTPDKTRIEVVRMGGTSASRMSLEPGWRWSDCIRPVAGTDSCQVHHVGVIQSGTLHVVHDDGSEQDIG